MTVAGKTRRRDHADITETEHRDFHRAWTLCGLKIRALYRKLVGTLPEPPRNERWQAEHEAGEQPQKHRGEQDVVAPVIEVRHAAFLGSEIPHWGGQVDDRHAAPGESYDCFRIEVEAAHPAAVLHD